MKNKIFDWIKKQRKSIIDPDNVGLTYEDAHELDEGEQTQLQLLSELEEFIKGL